VPQVKVDVLAEDSWIFSQRSSAMKEKLEKQLGTLQHQLNGARAAAKALGDSTNKEIKVVKKRTLSAAGRAAIVKVVKKKWAKVRKQAKKVAR
jgi:hypothetical protein